jgi:hypothetical protein
MRLKPVALGVALGLFWGIILFASTWLCIYTGYARLFLVNVVASLYPGYTINPAGSFVGLAYGFADGFASAAVLGWLYNKFSGADEREQS